MQLRLGFDETFCFIRYSWPSLTVVLRYSYLRCCKRLNLAAMLPCAISFPSFVVCTLTAWRLTSAFREHASLVTGETAECLHVAGPCVGSNKAAVDSCLSRLFNRGGRTASFTVNVSPRLQNAGTFGDIVDVSHSAALRSLSARP